MVKTCLKMYNGLKFLLSKSIPGREEVFEEVSESKMEPGDIVLFPLDGTSGVRKLFKHAGVYCGDGEVIHFQNTVSEGNSGRIIKEGFNAMKTGRGECNIYRKKGGIDLNYIKSKVREAMNSKADYSLLKNNCIHFALSLLGLEDFAKELVKFQD
ncbi:uncharacterized protein FYN12_006873 [Phoenicopterus ruber ruber]